MKLVSLYSFLVLFIAYVVGDQEYPKKVQPRIYGGSFARDGQFPYFGYVSYGSKRYCGASIIHQRWALTAAHCIRPRDNPTLTIGKVDDFSNGKSYKIEKFYIHDNYSVIPEELNHKLEYVVNDIAIVRLGSDIEFDETVNAVQLSTAAEDHYENETATIMGWGKTFYDGTPNLSLRYAEVQVLPMKECRKVWTYADKHLCTANRDRYGSQGVCYGDSGSPLVIGNIQIGVIATTDKYCESLKPDLHTRVADYMPWIKSILEKHEDSLPPMTKNEDVYGL